MLEFTGPAALSPDCPIELPIWVEDLDLIRELIGGGEESPELIRGECKRLADDSPAGIVQTLERGKCFHLDATGLAEVPLYNASSFLGENHALRKQLKKRKEEHPCPQLSFLPC